MDEFHDNGAARRFELHEEGGVTFADYLRRGDVVAITHVETPAHLRGRGAADRLMQAIVAKARAERLQLQPICTYAVAWLARHREHADLLA